MQPKSSRLFSACGLR